MRPGLSPVKAALLLGAAFLFGLYGCATSDSFASPGEIAAWASERGFSIRDIEAGSFRLAAFVREPSVAGGTMVVYIEGDGAPWPTPYHPPRDPTPNKPVSLALAAADPSPAVVYLGRPCQYLEADALRHCDSRYWIERRFAPEVVAAYDVAVTQLKSLFRARRLRLVGYSGGGVIVALLAARRDDVDILVTVAAPLALSEWVAWHDASPLTGSLDPAGLGDKVRLPPGVHFVGGNDRTVPIPIVERFVRRKGGRMETVPDFDHDCCWVRDWVNLLARVPVKENAK